jgi:hypothetical protein
MDAQQAVTGVFAALIISNALMFSWIFRNVALALAAGGIVLAFTHGDGVNGVMSVSQLIVDQYNSHADFGRGALLGAITAAAMASRFLRLQGSER